MKALFILTACLFAYQVLKAQTWSEWFRQNNTQLQYLQEQIAALQAYNNTQQAGYAVSETGLVEVNTTEEADEAEHAVHIAALQTPSQAVLDDPDIQDLNQIFEQCGLIANGILALGPLRDSETDDWVSFSEEVAKDIKQTVNGFIGRLKDIVGREQTEMSDAERELAIHWLRVDAMALYKKATYQLELLIQHPALP